MRYCGMITGNKFKLDEEADWEMRKSHPNTYKWVYEHGLYTAYLNDAEKREKVNEK